MGKVSEVAWVRELLCSALRLGNFTFVGLWKVNLLLVRGVLMEARSEFKQPRSPDAWVEGLDCQDVSLKRDGASCILVVVNPCRILRGNHLKIDQWYP